MEGMRATFKAMRNYSCVKDCSWRRCGCRRHGGRRSRCGTCSRQRRAAPTATATRRAGRGPWLAMPFSRYRKGPVSPPLVAVGCRRRRKDESPASFRLFLPAVELFFWEDQWSSVCSPSAVGSYPLSGVGRPHGSSLYAPSIVKNSRYSITSWLTSTPLSLFDLVLKPSGFVDLPHLAEKYLLRFRIRGSKRFARVQTTKNVTVLEMD